LQNNLNLNVSEVISTYTYKQGLAGALPQYSYSTAIGLFVSIINMVLLLTVNRVSRRLSGTGLW
ncbi:MAG: sugar ABC transporter permease, partial [Clostridia bacterium]